MRNKQKSTSNFDLDQSVKNQSKKARLSIQQLKINFESQYKEPQIRKYRRQIDQQMKKRILPPKIEDQYISRKEGLTELPYLQKHNSTTKIQFLNFPEKNQTKSMQKMKKPVHLHNKSQKYTVEVNRLKSQDIMPKMFYISNLVIQQDFNNLHANQQFKSTMAAAKRFGLMKLRKGYESQKLQTPSELTAQKLQTLKDISPSFKYHFLETKNNLNIKKKANIKKVQIIKQFLIEGWQNDLKNTADQHFYQQQATLYKHKSQAQ